MHPVGGQPGDGTVGNVVSKFHVQQMSIPVILMLIDNNYEYLSHGIVHALDVTAAVGMAGACICFSHDLKLVHSMSQLGVEMEAVVGVETNGASPTRGVLVHQDVSSALSYIFGRINSIHVCAPAQTVGEKEDVSVSFWRNREGADIIDADCDGRAGGQGE